LTFPRRPGPSQLVVRPSNNARLTDCFERTSAPANLGDDLLRRLGPDEGPRVLVVVHDLRLDRFDQHADTCEAAVSDASGRDVSEPAWVCWRLQAFAPRGTGWSRLSRVCPTAARRRSPTPTPTLTPSPRGRPPCPLAAQVFRSAVVARARPRRFALAVAEPPVSLGCGSLRGTRS